MSEIVTSKSTDKVSLALSESTLIFLDSTSIELSGTNNLTLA